MNSKAQLRVPLSQLLPHIPPLLHQAIRSSRYYAGKNDSLLIQSDESRKQSANKDTCHRRLVELVSEVFREVVPGETSRDQKEKVQGLQKRDNEARLRNKKMLSSKKASRSKSPGN